MPYVERDANGAIKGTYAKPQAGYAEDFLADSDSEVIAFVERTDLVDEAAQNGAALRKRQRNECKERILALIGQARTDEALRAITELI